MSCFKCEKCGCVENTATSFFWMSLRDNSQKLCSECDPRIGCWHDKFDKQPATGFKLGSDGFLYSPAEVERDIFKWRMEHQGFKIVGDA